LKDIGDFRKGKGYSKNDLTEKGYPIILYGRMYTNYESLIAEVNNSFVSSEVGAIKSRSGDIIVPSSGETAQDIARASSVKKAGIILGGDLIILSPRVENINSLFLATNISTDKQKRKLSRLAQGKTVVHLHSADLKNLKISLPTFREQTKISITVLKINDLIVANERNRFGRAEVVRSKCS